MQAYFKIVLRLRCGHHASAVYCFFVSWNEFMFALNFTGRVTRTVPVAIAALETQQGLAVAELCASCIVAIVPVAALSLFIKKYLVND
jgi:multiple sugar transport system permease protein